MDKENEDERKNFLVWAFHFDLSDDPRYKKYCNDTSDKKNWEKKDK